MSVQQHRSDPEILNRRTLQKDHRALAEVLLPGMSVLDVGCGTGAITKGIAEAVGPAGTVVGVDRDKTLLALAMPLSRSLPNLSFQEGDVGKLSLEQRFDVVTSARTLQWVADTGLAIANMGRAAKPNGLVVVLDYNHALHSWSPEPPQAFLTFFDAFLAWRSANGG